jgi:endonuclease/exonuclease/phosphatase family metal-dependent hydrolase
VAAPSEELRVFTANIICFPSILTYYYGGIAPWKTRIDKLAAVFKQTDAHIVCLQEVWDPEAMEALFERLKESYSFFVFDAGDPYSTLDPENMGYCSGLFVASRIPFDEVSFYPYVRTFPAKKGVKRGALLVKMTINGEKVTCLSTHLQHGTDENAEMIRLEQFARCHDLLQQAVDEGKENQSWGFLLGDINIDAFSKEFEQSQMQQLFLVPYIERQIKVTPANATATNYFNDLVYAPLDQRRKIVPFYELLDYCICLKTAPKPSTCKKVALFDVDKPMEALSDHQGLLTTWSLKDRR